jgi:hypothetical protein
MIIDAQTYWNFLKRLEGSWQGEITGKAGKGLGKMVCELKLGNKFVVCLNHAEFPPQEQNPEGEIHEDIGYYSFDKFTEKGRLRVFYSEGYVSIYDLIHFNAEENTIVFEATAHENLPKGFRAKITLKLYSTTEFEEKFELASPGKDYGMCIVNHWQKSNN